MRDVVFNHSSCMDVSDDLSQDKKRTAARGVFIRGMQLPRNCAKCDLLSEDRFGGEDCCAVDCSILADYDSRPEKCPMVDVVVEEESI